MSECNPIPLYQSIYNDLKEKIMSGVYQPGSRIPTELEIAQLYSVSRITATRAVKELETGGYIHRIRKRGSIVNPPEDYHENSNESFVVSVVLPFDIDISLEIYDGIQSNSLLNNYTISMYNSGHSEETERMIIENLLETDVKGFIVWPTNAYGNIDLFSKILIHQKPLVFLDFPKIGISAPCVSVDNRKAMHEITSYVISMGHRQIAFCGTSILRRWTEAERFKGYIEALVEHGIVPQDDYIIEITDNPPPSPAAHSPGRTPRQALEFLTGLPSPPTAVVCINDVCATFLESEALKLGIQIPQTLSITGFDDRKICSLMPVPITSVRQNFREIGKKALDLIDCMRKQEPWEMSNTFETQIIPRDSVIERTL